MKLVFSTNSYIKHNPNISEIKTNKIENPIVKNKSLSPSLFIQKNNTITNSLSMNMFNRIIQTSDCNCGK
jgi:hypothetical protein